MDAGSARGPQGSVKYHKMLAASNDKWSIYRKVNNKDYDYAVYRVGLYYATAKINKSL